MTGTTKMVSWPNSESYVCFAQVHMEGLSGSCSIILMLNYYVSNGLVKALYRDKDCKTVSTKLGYYTSDEEINWSVVMDGYTMTVSTDKEKMTPSLKEKIFLFSRYGKFVLCVFFLSLKWRMVY